MQQEQKKLRYSYFEDKLERAFQKIKSTRDIIPPNHWNFTKKDNQLDIINHSRFDSEYNYIAGRGEGIIPVNKDIVVKVLTDINQRKNYVKRTKSIETLEKTQNNYDITYGLFSAGYANDRDILAINGKFEENDGWTYIVSTSIKDDALKPEVQGNVRADTYYKGYALKSEGENKTRVVFIQSLNLKGYMFGFIMKMVAKSKGIKAIKMLRQCAIDFQNQQS